MHTHSNQANLDQVLEGETVPATPSGVSRLYADICTGCPERSEANQILNRGDGSVAILEIGNHLKGGQASCQPRGIQALKRAVGECHLARRGGALYRARVELAGCRSAFTAFGLTKADSQEAACQAITSGQSPCGSWAIQRSWKPGGNCRAPCLLDGLNG